MSKQSQVAGSIQSFMSRQMAIKMGGVFRKNCILKVSELFSILQAFCLSQVAQGFLDSTSLASSRRETIFGSQVLTHQKEILEDSNGPGVWPKA